MLVARMNHPTLPDVRAAVSARRTTSESSPSSSRFLRLSVDDGRAYLVVNVDPALVEQGVDAVSVVREAAKKIGGGGGGRPNLAEAGGKNPAGLEDAFEVGKQEIASARS